MALLEDEVRIQTHTEGIQYEDTGGRQPAISQGERP